tara:strand:- start:167 stop:1921 length:1755 start_codon:yes stop_codon:yes gene_type:complete
MSDDYKNLPSIDDFEESNEELPSVADLLEEKDLPSVEGYIEKEEEIEEEVQTLEDANGETFAEVKDIVPPWPELLRLVNDLKESIPEIPEIKSYDNELEELLSHIEQVKESIPEVPEVRYYEDDIQALKEDIEGVRGDIPKFPKWVNEVNQVPDFSWIGKTFGVIDDDFEKVNDNLHTLKDTFNQDIENLTENLELKDFEKKVEIKEVKEYLQETKDKIYEELKETALKIYEHRNQFKDDDRKLKKSVLSKLNEAKQNIEKRIDESNSKYRDFNKEIKNYFNGLKEEVANLPEVKYYDKDIKKLREKAESHTINIADLYKIVEDIKGKQEVLKEDYAKYVDGTDPARPIAPDPKEKQGDDPLTPTGDQKFATLQDLAANYRLFVNRVEQQLYTIGGGGAGFIKDLDDVNFDATNNDLLIYDGDNSRWVGIASTSLGSSTLTGLDDVDDSNLGDGRFLRYNATEEEFTFEPVSATNLELIAGDIQSGILTTSATGQATVMSISASTYRSASYQIQAVQGSNYNMTTINVIHDGTNTYMNEFGTLNQPTGIATFSTDINSGALRLLGYPASSSSTTFKVIFTALQV